MTCPEPFAWKRCAAAVIACGLLGCANGYPLQNDSRCTSWREEIQPIFASRCSGCHASADPQGGWDATTYRGALGVGSDDVPDALAGDPGSLVLRTIDPSSADAVHRPFADVFPIVREWVVDCRLCYFRSAIHPCGWVDPASVDFHGRELRRLGWDFGLCGKCHGSELQGTDVAPACTTCHEGGPRTCHTCHGSTVNDAPPRSTAHETSTEATGVGAHQSHLGSGALGARFECAACHVLPASVEQPGHILREDGTVDEAPAEVRFGPLAALTVDPAARSGPPTWDRDGATCRNVYCHGGAFADSAASNTTPRWTSVGAGQAACGTCHGLPPQGHHDDQCQECHGLVVDRERTIIAPELHVDGRVSLGNGASDCSACHGSASGPAPPRDLSGATSTDSIGVGAHQSHLQVASGITSPIACTACHLVPTEVGSVGHLDTGPPAEVFPDDPSFHSLAQQTLDPADRSGPPAFDRSSGRCANVYCHGDALGDSAASSSRPQWTAVGTGQAECGSCHGIPPAGHYGDQCSRCHSQVVDESRNIIDPSLHIDGRVEIGDATGDCTTCHGGTAGPAPPADLSGSSATTSIGVGAHQSHLTAGAVLFRPVDCTDCHVVPASVGDAGHADTPLPAEVFPDVPTFSSLATITIDPAHRAGPPAWDRASATCANVYCHGDVFGDTAATHTRPRWTAVGSGEAVCGACHGIPPAGHASNECSRCHRRVISASLAILRPELHVDGTVDLGDGSGACNGCHGDASGAAPPADLAGATSTGSIGVGAHRAHVEGPSGLRGPVPCDDCHLTPTRIVEPGHMDTDLPAEVFPAVAGFRSLGQADGASPVWDRAAGTCSGVYCHGNGTALRADTTPGLLRSPAWTRPGTGQVACGTACHAVPPSNAPHDASWTRTVCVACHSSTIDATGTIVITGAAGLETSTHIDGVVDAP